MPSKRKKFSDYIDPLILPAVEILNGHGFKTYESCQGGKGHCAPEPFVRFHGDEYDLIKAFEICLCYKLNAAEARRVFWKEDVYRNGGVGKGNGFPIGFALGKPFNEITFAISARTKTIFVPD